MVKEVYSTEELTELKKSKKHYVSICVLTTILLAIVCVTLCFLVNRNNAQIIKFGNITLCTVVGWYILYLICNHILPITSRIKRFDIWMYAPKEQFTGVVTQVGEIITLQRNMKVYTLAVQSENGDVQLYWDANKQLPDFGENVIHFQAVRHQIVAYEVAP